MTSSLDDFRDEEVDDADDEVEAVDDDRVVAAAAAAVEFGLAFIWWWLALPLALFFGSGLFRVDISDSGMVMYCWTPSSLCSWICPVCSRLINTS